MSRHPRDNRRRRRLLLSGEEAAAALPATASVVHVIEHGRDDEGGATEFFDACDVDVEAGAALHLETEVVAADEGEHFQTVPFPRPYLLLGRSEGCDLQLPHPQVSKRHALLQMFGDDLLCVDLASRTGTHWASGAKQSGWVDPGETFSVGPYSFSFGFGLHAAVDEHERAIQRRPSTAVECSFRPEDMPTARVEILNGRRRKARASVKPLSRLVTLVGWSRRCKIRLKHESVSRVHCAFVLTAKGVWIIDLLGRGGTLVNGRDVRFARLEEDDEVCVGKFHMRIRYGSLPRRRRGRGVSESFVLSLVDRFASMQQQMIEQQHDQMLLLTQMFGAIHHSQQDLIRDDLRRLHEITRELQAVQSELLRREAGATVSPPSAPTPEATNPATPAQIQLQAAPAATEASPTTACAESAPDKPPWPAPATEAAAERDSESVPPRTQEEPSSAPNTQLPEAASAEGPSNGPASEDQGAGAPTAEQSSAEEQRFAEEDTPDEPAAAAGEGGTFVGSTPGARRTGSNAQNPVDDHAWLQQRLRKLERERNSLWRKITRTLAGSGGA